MTKYFFKAKMTELHCANELVQIILNWVDFDRWCEYSSEEREEETEGKTKFVAHEKESYIWRKAVARFLFLSGCSW